MWGGVIMKEHATHCSSVDHKFDECVSLVSFWTAVELYGTQE